MFQTEAVLEAGGAGAGGWCHLGPRHVLIPLDGGLGQGAPAGGGARRDVINQTDEASHP